MQSISIIGAGAWGTAIAQALSLANETITLWARENEVVTSINARHENALFLPGISLSPNIRAVESIKDATEADIVLVAGPAQAFRDICVSIRHTDLAGKHVVICSKGFEIGSGLLLSQVAEEEIPDANIAVLTGPTFASDVAKGMPAAMTLASASKDMAVALRDRIGTKAFRPYASSDVIGAQIGGAAKNVVAIAAGICMGHGLGESARAALITRGVAEMARLTKAMGGERDTLMGMCGMGDLLLTCTSMQSRNYSFGVQIGEGGHAASIISDRRAVTEGYYSAKALMTLAKNQAVDMPIAETVYACLYDDLAVDKAIEDMLSRPFA